MPQFTQNNPSYSAEGGQHLARRHPTTLLDFSIEVLVLERISNRFWTRLRTIQYVGWGASADYREPRTPNVLSATTLCLTLYKTATRIVYRAVFFPFGELAWRRCLETKESKAKLYRTFSDNVAIRDHCKAVCLIHPFDQTLHPDEQESGLKVTHDLDSLLTQIQVVKIQAITNADDEPLGAVTWL